MNPGIPLYDRVIVRRVEAQDARKSAIITPDVAKKESKMAEVVAVGCGHLIKNTGQLVSLIVKVGDRVEMAHHTGHEIKVGDETLVVIREEEILRILPDFNSYATPPYGARLLPK